MGQCMEQDSAVHNHCLLEHDYCNHLHADCMETTRENHLDHLACGFRLYLCLVGHYLHLHHEVAHNPTTGIVDNRSNLLEAGVEAAADSCIGLMPSWVVVSVLWSRV